MSLGYPDLGDVERVATELMDKNGTTTTLEIKNQLRAEGFDVFQQLVAQSMYALLDIQYATGTEPWGWFFNGTYRHYYEDEEAAKDGLDFYPDPHLVIETSWGGRSQPVPATSQPAQPAPQAQPAPASQPASAVAVTISTAPTPGGWMCFSYSVPKKPVMFVTNAGTGERLKDRNIARQLYSVTEQVPYMDVGASRVPSDD